MTIFHIAIYKFSAVLIMKLPITFFIQIEKSPATHKEFQKTPKAKSILLSKKKKKSGLKVSQYLILNYTTEVY
jgi:hypothetical protein